jgi:hypothetical protein
LNCGPDRPRIGCVGLVRLYEGPNELRVQQDDIVPQCLDLARPPVRAAACLQRDSTWRSTAQVLDQIVTPEPAVHDLPGVGVDPVNLEHPLCYIQSVRRGIHLETSDRG